MISPGRVIDEGVTDLKAGMDFRRPEYRREVFLRFYEFHCRYGSHPGCVYYVIPYLRDELGWDDEAALWFAFLNGNTQNPVTSLIIHRRFPAPVAPAVMQAWFAEHYDRLAFDTDRRHHKKALLTAVASYRDFLDGRSQVERWADVAPHFAWTWQAARAISTFGRLSAWSYLEYLRILGVGQDVDTLMLEDRDGSRSHRNGLAKVCGRDDLDWHDSNPEFDGRYTPQLVAWLAEEGESLLEEAQRRAAGEPWAGDVTRFTLESTLCTYKGWHRPNRRYPNVYNDMLYGRLKSAEATWPGEDLGPIWRAREAALPEHLRLEASPHDPGCVPVKQNHYRESGQVVMMHRDWPCFANDLNDAIDAGLLPRCR